MARGRFMSLCRRCSQFTAGLSNAARKRAMTNQPMKVLTCQSKKNAPSTTAVVKRAMATVRITWVGEAPAHPASLLGMGTSGSVGVVSGCACACAFGCAWESLCGFSLSFMAQAYGTGGPTARFPLGDFYARTSQNSVKRKFVENLFCVGWVNRGKRKAGLLQEGGGNKERPA